MPDQTTQKPASDPQNPPTTQQSEQTAKVQSQSEKRNRFASPIGPIIRVCTRRIFKMI